MTAAEIEQYAAALEKNLVMEPQIKAAFIKGVREWAASDDGRPVLLINLMRFRRQLGPLPPSLDFKGSPAEANAHYEKIVGPLALKRGEHPLIGGAVQAPSLSPISPDAAHWDRVVIMRAPTRRAFIEFMAEPEYGKVASLKEASVDVALIPISEELTIPRVHWFVGALLLVLYPTILWLRGTL